MLSEMEIMARMQAITNEYAQIKNIWGFDISLEAIGCDGTVNVKIQGAKRKEDIAERIIRPQEDLSFIAHTLDYPNTFTPNSKMFVLDGLSSVHFKRDGYLIAIHDDGTVEQFKVAKEHRKEVTELLTTKLGNKFS